MERGPFPRRPDTDQVRHSEFCKRLGSRTVDQHLVRKDLAKLLLRETLQDRIASRKRPDAVLRKIALGAERDAVYAERFHHPAALAVAPAGSPRRIVMDRYQHPERLRPFHCRDNLGIIAAIIGEDVGIVPRNRKPAEMGVDVPEFAALESAEQSRRELRVERARALAPEVVRKGVRLVQQTWDLLLPEIVEELRGQHPSREIVAAELAVLSVADAQRRKLPLRRHRLRRASRPPGLAARHAGAAGDRRIDRVYRFADQRRKTDDRIFLHPVEGVDNLLVRTLADDPAQFVAGIQLTGATLEFREMQRTEALGVGLEAGHVVVRHNKGGPLLRGKTNRLADEFTMSGIERTEPHPGLRKRHGPLPLLVSVTDNRPVSERGLQQHPELDIAPLKFLLELPVARDQSFRLGDRGPALRMERKLVEYGIVAGPPAVFDHVLRQLRLRPWRKRRDIVEQRIVRRKRERGKRGPGRTQEESLHHRPPTSQA